MSDRNFPESTEGDRCGCGCRRDLITAKQERESADYIIDWDDKTYLIKTCPVLTNTVT